MASAFSSQRRHRQDPQQQQQHLPQQHQRQAGGQQQGQCLHQHEPQQDQQQQRDRQRQQPQPQPPQQQHQQQEHQERQQRHEEHEQQQQQPQLSQRERALRADLALLARALREREEEHEQEQMELHATQEEVALAKAKVGVLEDGAWEASVEAAALQRSVGERNGRLSLLREELGEEEEALDRAESQGLLTLPQSLQTWREELASTQAALLQARELMSWRGTEAYELEESAKKLEMAIRGRDVAIQELMVRRAEATNEVRAAREHHSLQRREFEAVKQLQQLRQDQAATRMSMEESEASEAAKEVASARQTIQTCRKRDVKALEAELRGFDQEIQELEASMLHGLEEVRAQREVMKREAAARLEHTEDIVKRTSRQCTTMDQRLQQQHQALSLADDQDKLGQFVIEELNFELEQQRSSEQAEASESADLQASIHRDREQLSELAREVQVAHEEVLTARQVTETDFVAAHLHLEASSEISAQERVFAEISTHLAAQRGELANAEREQQRKQRGIRQLKDAMRRQERFAEEEELKAQTKQQMVADARQQLAALEQREKDASTADWRREQQFEKSMGKAKEALEEWLQWGSSEEAEAEASADELGSLAESLEQRRQVVSIVSGQLWQLRAANAAQEEAARRQFRGLQEERWQFLRKARVAVEDVERQFRKESAAQQKLAQELGSELAEARSELAAAPESMQSLRAAIARERTRSASRVGALLAAVRGDEEA